MIPMTKTRMKIPRIILQNQPLNRHQQAKLQIPVHPEAPPAVRPQAVPQTRPAPPAVHPQARPQVRVAV